MEFDEIIIMLLNEHDLINGKFWMKYYISGTRKLMKCSLFG